MKIEDIINIKKDSTEEKIEQAIQDTKDELRDLDNEPNDALYTSSVATNLEKQHIHYEIVSTKDPDFDYPHEHEFIAVPKNEDELYIIDLKYKHFQSDKFKELALKGYQLIKGEECREYLDVVGNVKIKERKSY